MKIRIKVPDSDAWPEEYRSKEVEVEVDSVIFPNGMQWGVQLPSSKAEMVLELPPKPQLMTIADHLSSDQPMKSLRLDVEFFA